MREEAATSGRGALPQRSAEREDINNQLRSAQQSGRLSRQETNALAAELSRGGRYHGREEEVRRVINEGGTIEISRNVAERTGLVSPNLDPISRSMGNQITVAPPISIPGNRQSQPQPTQRQSNPPAVGLDIRNPEQVLLEALMRQMVPS